jgi:translation initiation factor 1 (eIF-1/SUI1)
VSSVFEVFELYKIDGSTEEFFKGRFRKGDIVAAAEIRQFVMTYVKENNLQNAQNPRQLKLDLLLMKSFIKNWDGEFMTFDAMFTALFAKMNHMHQIKRVYADKKDRDAEAAAHRIYKGKFQPVEFRLEQRGGNKKVTHIHNLSPFDLDPSVLQTKLKRDIGCSVTINEGAAAASASKDYFLTVQGNQIYPISELLKSKPLFYSNRNSLFYFVFDCPKN